MSDQHPAGQDAKRKAIFNEGWKVLEEVLGDRTIVENEENWSLDFDKGTVVVEHASVFERERLMMLAENVHRYGDRTAAFGPNLTNDEIEKLKTYFRVATVVRSKDELREWADNLDRSGARNLSETIEHVSDVVKPATDVAEMVRASKELLATAKELLANAKDLLLVGIAGHQVAKVMAFDLAIQSTQEALGRVLTIGSATGTLNPLSDLILNPSSRSWLAGTVENSFGDVKAAFSRKILLEKYRAFPHLRSQTRQHGSSREGNRQISRR
ncbi:MAG TPA: hypothetical protein VGZ00_13395, partial [Candidatus Baltobacteraceae bacterium]|jgi:hypothetical protein|nr:hypothetical protein [Candidatus Baltobacteraceae bacterium]